MSATKARRHVFDRGETQLCEREDRCRRCAMSRMLIATVQEVRTPGHSRIDRFVVRFRWLYRKHGGESWMTYYPRCAS